MKFRVARLLVVSGLLSVATTTAVAQCWVCGVSGDPVESTACAPGAPGSWNCQSGPTPTGSSCNVSSPGCGYGFVVPPAFLPALSTDPDVFALITAPEHGLPLTIYVSPRLFALTSCGIRTLEMSQVASRIHNGTTTEARSDTAERPPVHYTFLNRLADALGFA